MGSTKRPYNDAAYAIEFATPNAEAVKYVCSRLEQQGLLLWDEPRPLKSTISPSTGVIKQVRVTRETLETLAEMHGMVKLATNGRMEVFQRHLPADCKWSFAHYDDESHPFFEPCEAMSLLYHAMHSATTTSEMKLLMSSSDQTISDGSNLLASAKRMGWVHHVLPLHATARCKQVWQQCLWSWPLSWQPVQWIRSYYGNQVALYFAWMNQFTIWLIVPAVFGAVLSLHNAMTPEVSIDNSLLAPLFTLFMIVWGACFVQFWQRKCASLTCHWGTVFHETADVPRPEFVGKLRPNIISGRMEPYFAYRHRFLRYLGSCCVTGVMLCMAFFVMILSLNFQGYVHSNSLLGAWIHFPRLHQFSRAGAIFDQDGGGPLPLVLPYVPCVVHSLTILTLNGYYRQIAIRLTDWENHRLAEEYEDALMIKRFLFEAFDCYIALFYLAFCQNDIVLLRSELVSLYTVDSIRRIATECIAPLLIQHYSTPHFKESLAKKNDDVSATRSVVEDQLHRDEYEQFDDYMEMVIEFGYILLFASAFPLAPALSILCNIIEVKSDLFKLTYVVQRPHAHPVESVGRWLSVMSFLVWLSVLTNVFIFGFTTEQMMQLFPWMFKMEASTDVKFGGADHTHVAVLGQGRYVVGLVFAIEHLLLLVVKLVFTAIPSTPQKVQDETKRRHLAWHLLRRNHVKPTQG